jgi:myo-inositol catabolism protein IolS
LRYHNLGSSGIKISAIVFGCWQSSWVGVEASTAMDAVRVALDAGITTFDTAEAYGGGQSERVLAEALGNRRNEAVIATKVGAHNLAPAKLIEACERSLKNLDTDWIDLYQVHWPAGAWGSDIVPIADTLEAMVSLKESGKIRAIGVSNFDAAQLREAMTLAPIDSLQPPYSLFWRHIEKELLPLCQEHNVSVLAYSPLAQGLLTGKFGRDLELPTGDVRRNNVLFKGDVYERVLAALHLLRPIATRKNTSLGNLALAWIMHHPGCSPIVGARNGEQSRENTAATDVSLSDADISDIEAAGRLVTDYLDENPVLWR